MTNYLIKLTPLSPFFFAGEKNFGDGENANYFAKSNTFPQQTTVLGMLRKEILIQNSNVYKESGKYSDDEKSQIKELIGDSFTLPDADKFPSSSNNFGAIKKISPLFLAKHCDYFISTPKDHDFVYEPKKQAKSCLNQTKAIIPLLKNYKPKDGLPDSFISPYLIGTPIKFSHVFKAFVKVGNAKDKSEDDDNKFFKQKFYTMTKGYCFALFAEIDCHIKDSIVELKDSIVFMGGDNSSFKMNVETFEKDDQTFEELFISEATKEDKKITLLSDTLVSEDIYDCCEFAITETMDFRTIAMENGRFSKRADKYTMLKRGSVFFIDSKENRQKLEEKLKNPKLEQIGYNIFR
ncbi:MAG: hypothetical protein HQK72_02870 [Desulfamplus sp.]|nr:hypothetical protein [Desulfamplus sp.]